MNSKLFPNLFIIGASKTGTSALNAYLDIHPDVRMGDVKEPCFFVDQSELRRFWPEMANQPVSNDLGAYLGNFSGGESVRYRGDASTFYAMAPSIAGVPSRIKAAVPDARIIYVVREPLARTISHYWQSVKAFREKRPIEVALRENPIFRETSNYPLQLAPYLEIFDRAQIHIVVAEELRTRRREVLAEVFEWLGLPMIDFEEGQLADRHVSPPTSRRERLPGVSAFRSTRLWGRLRGVLPKSLISSLRAASTTQFNKKKDDELDPKLLAELRAYFAEQRASLEGMMGRRITLWDREPKPVVEIAPVPRQSFDLGDPAFMAQENLERSA